MSNMTTGSESRAAKTDLAYFTVAGFFHIIITNVAQLGNTLFEGVLVTRAYYYNNNQLCIITCK